MQRRKKVGEVKRQKEKEREREKCIYRARI